MDESPVTREPIEALRAEVAKDVRPHVMRLAPSLAEFAESFVYEQVWSRTELSRRDRSLVTIGALVALGATDALKIHVLEGLSNGLTKQEIGEIFTQLAPYAGWPLAATGAAAVADLVERADVDATLASHDGTRQEFDPEL